MYQNIYYQREKNLIHLWDDQRGYSSFPYTRYAYERAERGEYTSIYGDKLAEGYKVRKDDYVLLDKHVIDFACKTAERILKFMSGLTDTLEGYKVSRLEHSLQSATRALKAGESLSLIHI